MKFFLDDKRKTPDGWRRFYWPEKIIESLNSNRLLNNVKVISLDHDLGDDERTGYKVIEWIEKEVALHNYDPPQIIVHSDNPPGRMKMEAGIVKIEEMAHLKYMIVELLEYVFDNYHEYVYLTYNPFGIKIDHVRKSISFSPPKILNPEIFKMYFGLNITTHIQSNGDWQINKFDPDTIKLQYSILKL